MIFFWEVLHFFHGTLTLFFLNNFLANLIDFMLISYSFPLCDSNFSRLNGSCIFSAPTSRCPVHLPLSQKHSTMNPLYPLCLSFSHCQFSPLKFDLSMIGTNLMPIKSSIASIHRVDSSFWSRQIF